MLVRCRMSEGKVCSSRVLVHNLFRFRIASATVILHIQTHCTQHPQWGC